jgi:maltose O-acetyltransferase
MAPQKKQPLAKKRCSSTVGLNLASILHYLEPANIMHQLRLKMLVKRGLKLGSDCYIVPSAFIDASFAHLISIGCNCRITANVVILAHDASTKALIGYTKIGAVSIGNNCFVGSGSIILPGVVIGDNVVIGAGSVVTQNIPSNSVAVGNPARVVTSSSIFAEKHRALMKNNPQRYVP